MTRLMMPVAVCITLLLTAPTLRAQDSLMVVNKSVVQHRGFLGLDEVYVKSPITYDL